MHVRVLVRSGAVPMAMLVHDLRVAVLMIRRVVDQVAGRDAAKAPRVAKAPGAERDQHHGDERFQCATQPDADAHTERVEDGAGDSQRGGVPETPECAGQRAGGEPALARDDRRDGDEMIRVGRVLESQDESEDDRGRKVAGYRWTRELQFARICFARSSVAVASPSRSAIRSMVV